MDKLVSVSRMKKELMTSDFFMQCGMPMGYKTGFPVLQIRNGSLCLLFPFLKYQITGEVDKTLVFPIRYIIRLELPTGKVIAFENLEYDPLFENVNFDLPIGYFRHESIRMYDKSQYNALYDELMGQYDKLANALLFETQYSIADEERMAWLLQLLAEPSLFPIYKALDQDFFNKYMWKG